jgi:hypothetical protein
MPPPFGPRPPMTQGGAMPPRPTLPGNPAGGPAGPGSTPALAPGDGAGNEAAADAQVKLAIETLHKALLAYPIASKKYNGLINAVRALTANFGKETDGALTPAAAQQMAQAAKPSGAMAQGAPPPGLTPAPAIKPPTMAPMGMPGGGA